MSGERQVREVPREQRLQGFLVSMANFNAFYNSTIQIVFWGLLGIGMGIVTHRSVRRPGFNVIWRFGPGD